MDQSVKTLSSDGVNGRGWVGRIIIAVILGEAIWGLIVSVMNNVLVPWLGDVMGQSSGLPTSFTQRPYNYPDLFVSIFEFCIACLVAAILNYFLQRPRAARVKSVRSSVSATPAQAIQIVPSTTPTSAPINQAAPVQRAALPSDIPQPVVAQTNLPQPSVAQNSVPQANPLQSPSPVPPAAPVWVPIAKPQAAAPPAPAAVAPAPPAPLAAPPPVARPVVAATPTAPASATAEAARPVPPKPKAEPAKPKKPKQVYYNIVGEPMPSDED